MRVINLLLACLVSIGNCQQVQSFVAPEKALADILLANTPGAAFQVPVNTPAGSRLFNAPASAQAIHQQRVDEPSMSSSGYWQKFWSGGLRAVREQQEKEWWLSEWRFALYMDRYYNSSYAYNAKPSAIGWDNFWGTNFYTAPDVAFRKGVKQLQRVAANPWRTLYPGAIDNDPTGTKSFAPGQNSLDARYFKPPERASLDRTRIVNPDGFTVFGQQRSTDLARKRDSKIKEIKRRLAGIKQKNRPYKPRPGYKTLAEVAIEQAARKGNRRSSPTMSAADADRFCENYEMQAQQMKADVARWLEKNPQGLAVLKLKPYEVDMLVDTPETVAHRAARCRDVVMKPQSNFVADMQRRTIMNLLTLGAVSVPVGWILFIFISYFIPPNEGGAGGAVTALDAVGGAITFEGWLKDNLPETRKLVQGIRGDATYLIVNKDRKIEDFGVNAVCTHLGCVVPWNRAQNKFMCPCHGSQYDYSGKVVRGPAPLSLALAHVVDTGNGKVSFTPWTEQDFRTGQDPWWKP